MKYSIVFESSGVSGMKKSEMNSILRDGFAYIGEYWHRHFRARHFSNDAYQEYGYQRRTQAYNRRKIKHLGHNLPLVFTGESRDLSKQKKITATKNGVHVTMPVRKLNFKRSAKAPNMPKELTTISAREHAIMDEKMVRFIERKLQQFTRRRKQKI